MPMPKWGWKFGPRHYAYYMTESVPREQVEAKLKETLSRASKGHSWTNPWEIKHTEIVVDNEVVGNIWEDVDLSTLALGAYWVGPWGIKAELVKDGRIVGMIWLKP
jgi:hypothetical protein